MSADPTCRSSIAPPPWPATYSKAASIPLATITAAPAKEVVVERAEPSSGSGVSLAAGGEADAEPGVDPDAEMLGGLRIVEVEEPEMEMSGSLMILTVIELSPGMPGIDSVGTAGGVTERLGSMGRMLADPSWAYTPAAVQAMIEAIVANFIMLGQG